MEDDEDREYANGGKLALCATMAKAMMSKRKQANKQE
jgi:hypothetical protein